MGGGNVRRGIRAWVEWKVRKSGKERETAEAQLRGDSAVCGAGQTPLAKWALPLLPRLERVPTQQARARINRHHTFFGPPTFSRRSWAADWLSDVQGDTGVKVESVDGLGGS